MHAVNVLLPTGLDRTFTYQTDQSLATGQLVNVPFRSKTLLGVVWSTAQQDAAKTPHDVPQSKGYHIKEITEVLPFPPLPLITQQFIDWVAHYTLSPRGMVLKMVVNPQFIQQKKTSKPLTLGVPDLKNCQEMTLSPEQTHATKKVIQAIQSRQFQSFLLDGVTGSGKTEVYLAAMTAALEQGQQVLVLLPEIALTAQWLGRFERRFGCPPLQWHSGLTESQRRQTWQAILKGQAPVIVGARSALFLPFPDLGLIIVDEEHDPSYKQEEQVIYHARDMAVVRAKLSEIPIILVSATPSLETIVNVQQQRYQHLVLKERHAGALMPKIDVIDMRAQPRGWISPPLHLAINETLFAGEQVMLFLNRRGYAPLTLCSTCGFRFQCPGCTAWLVEHKNTHRLMCHYCGHHQQLPPECPECLQKDTFVPCGPGVERIFELTEKLFPNARIVMLTSDLVTSPKEMHAIIDQVTNHEIDILIGTQILAKGHHFPLITLVGVIDADLGIGGGDLRACERTYQLLHQVAGRAGREQRPGRVLLQTFTPQHPVMQALIAQNRDQFLEREQEQRSLYHMPPFGRLAAIIISGLKQEQVARAAEDFRKCAPTHPDVIILGPVPAPLAILRGRHRWRILLKTTKNINIQAFLRQWLESTVAPSHIDISIDIDPYSFM